MRGHIAKRYKNSYTIVLNLGRDPITCKPKQQWVSVKGTKRDAEQRLAELLHQLGTGTFVKPRRTTFGEFLGRWLEDYACPNLAPRTVEGYESIIRAQVVPSLGNIRLAQLKPEHLQRYYSRKLSEGRCDGTGPLSQTTVSHHHTCLHRALKMAVQWGLINRNPADAVTPPRPRRPEMQTMNEEEVQTLLEAAKGTPYYALFYLLLFTGLRRSEFLALRWCDVDLVMGEISVTRSLHHLRDGSTAIRQVKTKKARRQVALPPTATLVLRKHKEKRALECAMLGTSLRDDDLVFSQLSGEPLLPDTVSHAWT